MDWEGCLGGMERLILDIGKMGFNMERERYMCS
jgi:hypothetical protein